MEAGMIATLVIGSLLTTGAAAGIASTNGDMMQGTHMGGMYDFGSHDHEEMHEECEEHMEDWEHEYCEEYEEECEDGENGNFEEMHEECEEHMEERENEHSFDDEDHEEHDHCGMMG
ncbi:MAG: hypothetical protein LN415_08440 [Candidatus Thermoplasmatota archaeon]|nr:hypothetical protein [Candidatus Thermoplasmatota archaeon]